VGTSGGYHLSKVFAKKPVIRPSPNREPIGRMQKRGWIKGEENRENEGEGSNVQKPGRTLQCQKAHEKHADVAVGLGVVLGIRRTGRLRVD